MISSGITLNDLLNYLQHEEEEEMDLMEVERLVQDVEETDGDVNTEDVIQLSSLREDDGVFRATLSHLLRNVYKTVREENS